MKKTTAGKRDLSAAVARVHQRQVEEAPPLSAQEIDAQLLLGPGDEPGRQSYFDHNDGLPPVTLTSKAVHLTLGKGAHVYDYRDENHRRSHRKTMTIPPKLRENLCKLLGTDDDERCATVAIIALADYAAAQLLKEGKRLHVEAPKDPRKAERLAQRRRIRAAKRG